MSSTPSLPRREFLEQLSFTAPLLWTGAWLSACQGGVGTTPSPDLAILAAQSSLPASDALALRLKRTRFATTRADFDAAQAIGWDAYLNEQLRAPSALDPVYLEADLRYPLTAVPPPFNFAGVVIQQQISEQLAERSLFLAAYSNHQLYELTVDFWTNHFNIENVTGELPLHKLHDDREVIRRHAFGRFADILHASAKSPAMLEYLDGVSNVAAGPNENYARELMELHTLGVDGGYTEDDVREVARCFTGWTINGLSRRFQFDAARHDDGEKTVLGTTIPAGGGIRDGELVLDILANHPATATFISRKLAQRFISDAPPASIVQRLAQVFQQTQGDTPSLLRALFDSDEFAASADAKLRRPLEFVAQTLRTLRPGGNGFDGPLLRNALSRMGQIPHRWFPPDGYPDSASYWLNTSVLLEYWNFVAELVDTTPVLASPATQADDYASQSTDEWVKALAQTLLLRDLRSRDLGTLVGVAQAKGPDLADGPSQAQVNLITGLLLASPSGVLR